MRLLKYALPVLLFVTFSIRAQYTLTSPYLQNPAKAIGYVDSCAQFWLNTWDNNLGGFFSNIDRYGNTIWNTDKNMLTQSRNAYGLVRAYMLTADTTYLNLARRALDFMYQHAWDQTYGGWFQELDVNGNPLYPFSDKTAFYQHYALLGIAAFYEATRDVTAWNWLMQGYNHLETNFWDTRPAYLGYYDATEFSGANPHNKSFNATVDAVTTHLLYLWLLTENPLYKSRLQELAEEMKTHLVASMPAQAIGFVEKFDSDWNWDNQYTLTLMGHLLKTAWCLGRIFQIAPDFSYLPAADSLFRDVWNNGYDHQFGGPYKDFDRVTGELLLWGNPDTTKAWWQMEQAITAGLMLFDITGDSLYLQMADESLNFFMKYFVDHQYGEVYADRTRYGAFAWNENKAGNGKAGYHSIELGYYVYLYGNLFLHRQPVTLHYNFVTSDTVRLVQLTPLAIADSLLKIESVLHQGQPYTNFSPDKRVLYLPPGVGGHFAVTFRPLPPTGISHRNAPLAPHSFTLYQNHPNPFNSTTHIGFQIADVGFVSVKIYDVTGREVATLISEKLPAGKYEYQWDASGMASGMYLCRLETEKFTQTRKLILLK